VAKGHNGTTAQRRNGSTAQRQNKNLLLQGI